MALGLSILSSARSLISLLGLGLVVGGCSRSDLGKTEDVVVPYREGMTLREAFDTLPASAPADAKLKLLEGNVEAWAERWRLLANAERTLDVSYFILHQDIFGVAFLGHVLEKARAGVEVRLLLDAQGTKMSWTPRGDDYLDELVATGNVEIKSYRPLVGRWLEALVTLDITRVAASEHDKIIVADGERSLIGGRNIGGEYFTDPRESPASFHDTDMLIDGAASGRALTEAFEAQYDSQDAWNGAGENVNLQSTRTTLELAYRAMDEWLRNAKIAPPLSKDLAAVLPDFEKELSKYRRLAGALRRSEKDMLTASTRVIDSQTRQRSTDDPITQSIARLVRSSTQRIVLQSPYLVLSEDGVALLADAARRGVKIVMLTNSPASSDNALSQAFFLEQWPEILARVPTMKLYVGGTKHTLHSKVSAFDGSVAMVGTYNLDPTSMEINSEVVATVWSEKFAGEVERITRRTIERGAPEAYEYRIRRTASGEAVRGKDGRPIVERGPQDHTEPKRWTALNVFWKSLRAAESVGVSPFL